ncbi:hypothetical protein [Paenibacillus sp. GYB003]|uniref:hypothetical protein n=1 Tax=Paenibacillus sp. GYB003 TaxID=2994392 RepID=UPI002F9657FC
MSVQFAESVEVTAEDMHLIRNLVILPVVLSAFESDIIFFESNRSPMTQYVTVAQRAITRIQADMERLGKILRKRGIVVYDERRNQNGINRPFNYRGKRNVYALRWGTFDAEITLLTDYYLGNLSGDGRN